MYHKLRGILACAVAIIMIFAFVACGSSTDTTNNSDSQNSTVAGTSTQPKEIKSLTLMAPTQWLEWAGSKAVTDYFNNSKTQDYGAKLELVKVPEGDQGTQVVKAKFAAGDVPDLLFWFDTSSTLDASLLFAEQDPEADWTKNFGGITGDLNQIKYMKDGKLYGVPFGESTTTCVFYNKKVFADAGVQVPKTWEEFLQVCDAIKAKGVTPVYYSGKDAWTLQLIPILGWGYGALEPDAATLINSIETNKKKIESLGFLVDSIAKTKELLDKGYVQKTWLSDTYVQAQQALTEGKAGMYPMGTWVIPEFIKVSSQETVNGELGAFAMPLGAKPGIVFTGPSAIFVSKNGQNVELAKEVATYFGTVEAQNQWFNVQPGIPFIKGITANLQGPFKDLNDIFNSEEKLGDFMLSAKKGYGWSNGLDKDIQDLLVGVKTPLQVAQTLDVEWAKQAKSKNDPDFK